MKQSVFLVIVVVVATTYASIDGSSPGKYLDACVSKSSFYLTHNVAHETDPHKFYKCLGPYGFVVDCPELKGVKLIFNEKEQVCDWDGTTTNPSSTTDSNTESTTQDSSTESTTEDSNTESTTKDSNTESTTKDSNTESTTKDSNTDSTTKDSNTESTTKDSNTESTTKDSNTESTGSEPSTTSPPTTIVPGQSCEVDGENEPHKDCHRYFKCVNGKYEERECQEGMNFNPAVGKCDYVDCKQ